MADTVIFILLSAELHCVPLKRAGLCSDMQLLLKEQSDPFQKLLLSLVKVLYSTANLAPVVRHNVSEDTTQCLVQDLFHTGQ